MNWRRSLLLLLVVASGSVTVFASAYLIARRISAAHLARSTDDLDWLQREFGLSAGEMERIRQLHAGYLPECEEMCQQIAATKADLTQLLSTDGRMTAGAEEKLAEVGALRARCQSQMLRHFYEVSQAMPPEQGRRYLAEMHRLTLGSHEAIERSMSGSQGSSHQHH